LENIWEDTSPSNCITLSYLILVKSYFLHNQLLCTKILSIGYQVFLVLYNYFKMNY